MICLRSCFPTWSRNHENALAKALQSLFSPEFWDAEKLQDEREEIVASRLAAYLQTLNRIWYPP